MRYSKEFQLDAIKVQLQKDMFPDDMNDQVAIYEQIEPRGRQSLVVHHMRTRGSGRGVKSPDSDTLLSLHSLVEEHRGCSH